jgi:hypothetical protein
MVGRMGWAGVPAWAGIVFRQEAPGKPIEWRKHPGTTDGKTAHFWHYPAIFPDNWAKSDSIAPVMLERMHPLIEAVTEPLAKPDDSPSREAHGGCLRLQGLDPSGRSWSRVANPVLPHRHVERFEMRLPVLAALAVPPALCLGLLFANALRIIFGKPATRLDGCAVAIAVLPAYGLATILLCSLMPIYSAAEKHWIAKETLLRIDPDAPDLGAYEFKVAAQKRKEINAITGVE